MSAGRRSGPYREGCVTDNGQRDSWIVHNMQIHIRSKLEEATQCHLFGSVCNGLFCARRAGGHFAARNGDWACRP